MTKEKEKEYVIEVIDDGEGFEIRELGEYKDGKLHVGIKNVSERLEMLVKGTLKIESKKGKGTRASICIPKQINMID